MLISKKTFCAVATKAEIIWGCRRQDRHENTVTPRQPPVNVGNVAVI